MSDLLSRARDAEDLDCPSRDCGSICQGELIREMADEIERLRGDAASLAAAREQLLVQADEIKRLLRSHYEIERLNAEIIAATELLKHSSRRISWGHDFNSSTKGYFLDGEYAGEKMEDVIKKAAKKGA